LSGSGAGSTTGIFNGRCARSAIGDKTIADESASSEARIPTRIIEAHPHDEVMEQPLPQSY
jgi:hypothetical protein